MLRLRSRLGNVALAVVGAVYAVAGGALLIWSLVDTWPYAGRSEYLLYLLLGFAMVVGAWFVKVAIRSLRRAVGLPRFDNPRDMAASTR